MREFEQTLHAKHRIEKPHLSIMMQHLSTLSTLQRGHVEERPAVFKIQKTLSPYLAVNDPLYSAELHR